MSNNCSVFKSSSYGLFSWESLQLCSEQSSRRWLNPRAPWLGPPAKQTSALTGVFLREREDPLGHGRTLVSPRAGPVCDVSQHLASVKLRTWIWRCCTCWWLNQGCQRQNQTLGSKESRAEHGGLWGSLNGNAGTLLPFSVVAAAVWHPLTSPSRTPENQRPLGAWLCGLLAWGLLISSGANDLGYPAPVARRNLFFLTSLWHSLTDLNNSKAPI